MNLHRTKTILIISDSVIFIECINKILSFTLKTNIIQSHDNDILFKDPARLPHFDTVILDCRFTNDLDLTALKKSVYNKNDKATIIIFTDSQENVTDSSRVQFIKSNTEYDVPADLAGYFNIRPQHKPRQTTNTLTRKENEIAQLISIGLNNKQIAQRQNISEKTVKAHLTSIYRKLNISNRYELMFNSNKAGT